MKFAIKPIEIRIKAKPGIYPIGQRGTILPDNLIQQIVEETRAEKIIDNVVWRLDNIRIHKDFTILQAFYDTSCNEIILQLIPIKSLPCKWHLEDCIHCDSKTCNDCIDGNLYDDENK